MLKFDPSLLLQVFGIVFLAIGMAARLGFWKKWYWRTKGSIYGYMPLGLMFLLYSFYEPMRDRLGASFWMYQSLFAILILVGGWWSFRPPGFIKPAWVRWIEAYPKEARQSMESAAAEDPNWESHVTTPEAIEAWVKGLKMKKPRSKTGSKAKR